MLAVTAFYGTLCAIALWACWRNGDFFWIAFWLIVNCVATNAIQYGLVLPIEDSAARLAAVGSLKPGPFTFVEAMTAVAALCAWMDQQNDSRWISRGLVALVGCNLLSICFNVALAAHFLPNERQVFIYEATTNLIFAAECLLAFSIGIADGVRTGRFSRWRRFRGRRAERHAAGTAEIPKA